MTDSKSEPQAVGFVTPPALAKRTGQRPQAVYNMIRARYIRAEQRNVVDASTGAVVGTRWLIRSDVADAYEAAYKARKALRGAAR